MRYAALTILALSGATPMAAQPSVNLRPSFDLEGRHRSHAAFYDELRRKYPGYDNWTLDDVYRLEPDDVFVWRHLASIGGERSWQRIIPRSIRDRYGDQAVAEFIGRIYNRMRQLDVAGALITWKLQTVIGHLARMTQAETAQLDVTTPIEVPFLDGSRERATPGEAYTHYLDHLILERPDRARLFGMRFGIPRVIIEGIAANNLRFRDRLLAIPMVDRQGSQPNANGRRPQDTVEGPGILPGQAYDLGQSTQSGYSHNLNRYGVSNPDRATVCRQLRPAEIDIWDDEENDITLEQAWHAGALRALLGNSC